MAKSSYEIFVRELGAGDDILKIYTAENYNLDEIKGALLHSLPSASNSMVALNAVNKKRGGAPGKPVVVVGFEHADKITARNVPRLHEEFPSGYDLGLYIGCTPSYVSVALLKARNAGRPWANVRGIRVAWLKYWDGVSGQEAPETGPGRRKESAAEYAAWLDEQAAIARKTYGIDEGIGARLVIPEPKPTVFAQPAQPAAFAQPAPSEAAPMVQALAEIPILATPDPIKFTI